MKSFNFVEKKDVVFPRPDNPERVLGPYLKWVGQEHRGAGSDVYWRAQPQDFLMYVLEGNAAVRINNNVFSATTGSLIHYRKADETHMLATTSYGIRLQIVNFYGILFKEHTGIESCVFNVSNSQDVLRVMRMIFDQASSHEEYAHDICSSFLIPLVKMIAQGVRKITTQSPGLTTYLEMRQYIDGNFTSIGSIREVAEHQGMSSEHATRIFKEKAGETPLHYLNRRKMGQACEWLLQTEMSLSEIAQKLQFSNANSFSRCFLKYIGQRPGAFRKG